MTIISRAAYARHCGVSVQAIDKAIKRRDLPLNEQGLIEFEYARQPADAGEGNAQPCARPR